MAAKNVTRAMSTLQQRAASAGAVAPWKPKVVVYRHLSPFEVEVLSPFNKWLATYKEKAIENYHWILAPTFFFAVKITGDTIFEGYAWEHALHVPGEDHE